MRRCARERPRRNRRQPRSPRAGQAPGRQAIRARGRACGRVTRRDDDAALGHAGDDIGLAGVDRVADVDRVDAARPIESVGSSTSPSRAVSPGAQSAPTPGCSPCRGRAAERAVDADDVVRRVDRASRLMKRFELIRLSSCRPQSMRGLRSVIREPPITCMPSWWRSASLPRQWMLPASTARSSPRIPRFQGCQSTWPAIGQRGSRRHLVLRLYARRGRLCRLALRSRNPQLAGQRRIAPTRQPRRRPLRVFLNYRRDDAAGTLTLYDLLVARYAPSVFMDIDAIPLGSEFDQAINRAVASCDVLIALMGRGCCKRRTLMATDDSMTRTTSFAARLRARWRRALSWFPQQSKVPSFRGQRSFHPRLPR